MMRLLDERPLRRELDGWSREDLVAFVADCAAQNQAILDRFRRRESARAGGARTLETFQRHIDEALAVREVRWDGVAEYVRRLDMILTDVACLGEHAPREALEIAFYFLEKIPTVADAVDGEDELDVLCEEIGRLIVAITVKSGTDRHEVARRLVDVAESDPYGNTSSFPSLARNLE
jgi:hypothetical protein